MRGRSFRLFAVLAVLALTGTGLRFLLGGVTENAAQDVAAARRVTPRLTQELAAKKLRLGAPVFLRIFKESNELELWVEPAPGKAYQHFKTYEIAYYSGTLGPKLREGDGQAPEGFYAVGHKQMNPRSQFHLSFNIGYPNAYDRHHRRTGSAIMVHGSNVSIGCFAMTDPRIEEIYTLVDAALRGGQPFFRVHCFPFRMTSERLAKADQDQWLEFWRNLQECYDWFEEKKRPPNTVVSAGRYQFE